MPCLLGCLALFVPRIVLVLVFIFNHPYLSRVYQTVIWPLLGFFFMPLTTLAYAFAINSIGRLDGVHLFIYVVAVLIDLGLLGSGESSRRRWWKRQRP